MDLNVSFLVSPFADVFLVAGADFIWVDATCCRIMGIDPGKVPYLKLAEDRQQLRETEVQQVGESVAAVRTDFQLIRPFNSLRWKA
jgi:uncharacterized protein (DUF362 family)